MIGGNPAFKYGCRAVYLPKRLAALQRLFRAALYAVRIMPRRKRILTALYALAPIDADLRHHILALSGLAQSRTTPPKPYTLWTHSTRSVHIPVSVVILHGNPPGDLGFVQDMIQQLVADGVFSDGAAA